MSCHADLLRSLGSVLAALSLLLCSTSSSAGKGIIAGNVTVDLSGAPLSEFSPDETFGAALDGLEKGEVDKIYTEQNIRKMRSAGLRKITYRLRTELGIGASEENGVMLSTSKVTGFRAAVPTNGLPSPMAIGCHAGATRSTRPKPMAIRV